jgi:hypothetical protein
MLFDKRSLYEVLDVVASTCHIRLLCCTVLPSGQLFAEWPVQGCQPASALLRGPSIVANRTVLC